MSTIERYLTEAVTARVIKTLDDTAEVLTARGWGQGADVGYGQHVCLIEAIDRANPTWQETFITKHLLREDPEVSGGLLMQWNDAPGRRVSDIYALIARTRQRVVDGEV